MRTNLPDISAVFKICAAIVLFPLSVLTVGAQDVTEKWRQIYNPPEESRYDDVQLATDATGSVFVAANEELESTQTIIGYSPEGEEIWRVTIPDFLINGFAVDAGNGVFVTGSNAQSTEMKTYRLSKEDGSISWLRTYDGGFERDVANAIEINAAGEVYIVGLSDDRLALQRGMVLIKYDGVTGDELWTSVFFNPTVVGAQEHFSYNGTELDLDQEGGIYVAGSRSGRQDDYWIAKFSDSDGAMKWSVVYGTRDDVFERVQDLSVDDTDGVFVTGLSYGKITTLKLDKDNGAILWESSPVRSGSVNSTGGYAVTHNSEGVFITGELQDNSGLSHMITIKYNQETGAEEWANLTDNDRGIDIALDNEGALYTLSSKFVITKYNTADGIVIWATRPDDVEGTAYDFEVSTEGDIIVAGITRQLNNSQLLTIKYSQGEGGEEPCYLPLAVKLSLPPHAVKAGETVLSTARFGGYIPGDAHNIRWVWGDNTEPVEAYFATGDDHITGEHIYQQPGIYRVSLDFSQSCLVPQNYDFEEWVIVYDPMAGFVTGGGQINSPQTSLPWMSQQQNAQFSFNVRYNKANDPTPQGQTQLSLHGQGVFRSKGIEWLVVRGNQAVWQGTGTLNGQGNYGFTASVWDARGEGSGDAGDELRIRIWDKNSGNALVYDNFESAGDIYDMTTPTSPIARGQIIIHPISAKGKTASKQAALYNYPNTFKDKTNITFTAKQAGAYRLEVYDMRGKLVKQLWEGQAKEGQSYSVELDGTLLPKGIYVARLVSSTGSQSIRMLLER